MPTGATGGHLVYGAAGTLRAVAFDLARLAVVGTSVPVVPQVMTTATGAVNVAVAGDGTLVYVPGVGGVAGTQRLPVWVDRQGQETPIAVPLPTYDLPRISPDGTRVALHSNDQELDIWLWDLVRGGSTRVTFDPGNDLYAVWAPPDGRRLIFTSERAGARNLFTQAADGTGAANQVGRMYDIAPDGRRFLMIKTSGGSESTPAPTSLVVVQHFGEELKRLVPSK